MARHLGYTCITSPDGVVERDLYKCNHCQRIVTFKPGQMPEDAGGFCKQCGELICKECYTTRLGCDVFDKKLARIEAKLAFLNSAGV